MNLQNETLLRLLISVINHTDVHIVPDPGSPNGLKLEPLLKDLGGTPCSWPEPPANGLNRRLCGANVCEEQVGTLVPEGTYTISSCLDHFLYVRGPLMRYCGNGTWSGIEMECIIINHTDVHTVPAPGSPNGLKLEPLLKDMGGTPCSWPEPPANGLNRRMCGVNTCKVEVGTMVPEGTYIVSGCLDHFLNVRGKSMTYCKNGTWPGIEMECIMCGRSQVHKKSELNAKLGDFPWMAGLYYENKEKQWELRCGGALITAHIVLTAAHCLKSNSTIVKPKEIKVGLGKLLTDFNALEKTTVIKKVRKIIVPDHYLGFEHNFVLDIALLDLEDIVETSPEVMPACIDWGGATIIQNGESGYVAGYGLLENGSTSDVLKWSQQKYINYSSCIGRISRSNIQRLTHDKFCINSVKGAKTDQGDSGGGLTFVKDDVHYLYGVVSTRPLDERDDVVMFTSVPEYTNWLKTNINKLYRWHYRDALFDHDSVLGDACKEVDGQLWYCKHRSECPTGEEAFRSGQMPETCFSEDSNDVVCCKPQDIPEEPSTKHSISEKMCKKYSESFRKDSAATCSILKEPIKAGSWGPVSNNAEFPHMALVTYDEFSSWTYASLISERFVITEAFDTSNERVYGIVYTRAMLGTLHYTGRKPELEYTIVMQFYADNYDRDNSRFNNLLLLRLGSNVEFSAAVRPICLFTEHLFPGSYIIITSESKDLVIKENTTVVGKEQCDKKEELTDESIVCVKVDNQSKVKDPYGAPLVVAMPGHHCMYGLVGIHNFNSSDHDARAYTRVSHYVDWIESKVWKKPWPIFRKTSNQTSRNTT